MRLITRDTLAFFSQFSNTKLPVNITWVTRHNEATGIMYDVHLLKAAHLTLCLMTLH